MVCIILVLLLPPICEMKKQVIWSENPEHRMAVVVAVDKRKTPHEYCIISLLSVVIKIYNLDGNNLQ